MVSLTLWGQKYARHNTKQAMNRPSGGRKVYFIYLFTYFALPMQGVLKTAMFHRHPAFAHR